MIVTSVQIKTVKTQKHLYCPVFTDIKNTNADFSGVRIFYTAFKHSPKCHLKFFQNFYVRKLNSG